MVKVVSVRYPSDPPRGYVRGVGEEMVEREYRGKTYSYNCLDDSIKVDDYAVASSPSGLVVVKVVAVSDTTVADYRKKYLVQKVDIQAFKVAMAKQDRLQSLMSQLRERASHADEMSKFEALAGHDPELQSLLIQFKEELKEES